MKLQSYAAWSLSGLVIGCGPVDNNETRIQTQPLLTRCADSPSEANCTGRDPVAEGCDVSSRDDIVAAEYFGEGDVRLFYSCACKSAWAVTLAYRGPSSTIAARIRDAAGAEQYQVASFQWSVRTKLLYDRGGSFAVRGWIGGSSFGGGWGPARCPR